MDSEPIHLAGFQRVLALEGVELTRQEYYKRYLGFDDYDGFRTIGHDKGVSFTDHQIDGMVAAKTEIVKRALTESAQPLDGAVDLIRSAGGAGIPLAVCSGALRDEVILAVRAIGVLDLFDAVVGTDDVERSKPDPQSYMLAIERVSKVRQCEISPEKSLAIEDSPIGITSAKSAGMKVLAVTTSYESADLTAADKTITSLADVTISDLEKIF